MKPTPLRKKTAKRILLVGCLLLLTVIVAALVNPLIVKVPLKMLLGEGALMRHMAMVHATLNGTDIEYDVYGGRTTHAASGAGTELVLISKSSFTMTNAHGLFSELLVRNNNISFPGGLEFLKLPFGFFPMTGLGGIEATSGKAGCFSLETTEVGYDLQYHLRSEDSKSPLEFDLFVPLSLTPSLAPSRAFTP